MNSMTYSQRGYYVEMLCKLHTLDNPAYFMYGDSKMSKKVIQKFLLFPVKIFNFFIEKNLIIFDEKEQVYFQPKLLEELELSQSKQKGGKVRGEQLAKHYAKHSLQHFPDSDSDTVSFNSNKNNNINIIGEFYEKNIGMLTPYVCEELQELEKQHKEQNVIKALKLTAEAGVRSIRYVKAILDSEAVGGYKFEKLPKTVKDPLLGKLPPVIRKQVEHMIEEFIKNTGEQPKDANIKLMIKKVTHE